MRHYCGQVETPLTEVGRQQAIDAGKKLARLAYVEPKCAISSPLARAVETLSLVSGQLSPRPGILPPLASLMERSHGLFEGVAEGILFRDYPHYRDDPHYCHFMNHFEQWGSRAASRCKPSATALLVGRALVDLLPPSATWFLSRTSTPFAASSAAHSICRKPRPCGCTFPTLSRSCWASMAAFDWWKGRSWSTGKVASSQRAVASKPVRSGFMHMQRWFFLGEVVFKYLQHRRLSSKPVMQIMHSYARPRTSAVLWHLNERYGVETGRNCRKCPGASLFSIFGRAF